MQIIKTQSEKETEIKNLEKFLRKSPTNSVVMEFTPSLAEHILSKLNIGNRPQKPQRIVDYAKDMAAHNWSLTGETICFGNNGRLLDGQNRLAACIRAQTSFETHVIFGIDPATFHHMDTGKNRGGDDILAIMGVPNSSKVAGALKMIRAWKRGVTNTQGTVSNQIIKDMYLNEIDEELMQRAIKSAKNVYNVISFPIGQTASLYYIASQNGDEDLVDKFYSELRVGGSGTSKYQPSRHLVETLTRMKMNRERRITSHDYSVMLTRAWYNFKHKKRSKKADMEVYLDDKLMEI